MRKKGYVYILTNHTNTVLYVGVTSNIELRYFQHYWKQNPKSFSARYRLYKLVWFETFDSIKLAIEFEKKIKGWKREKKVKLIQEMNPGFKNLFSLGT